MRPSSVIVVVAVGAVLATIGLIATGEDGYRVEVHLENAAGLRKNSDVRVGGVPVGKVAELSLDEDDVAVAELALDESAAPIGTGARATVRSANLLGDKYVELDGGDPAKPQPSGTRIPRERTATPVDLDELIDVLGPRTRVRLSILIDEAGVALAGRHADFNAMLARLPSSLDDTSRVVAQFAADNRALGRLLERSDRVIGSVATERAALGRLVSTASGTFDAVAARREELGRTIDNAPGGLRQLRAWLAQLDRAAVALGPAAESLQASAPGLLGTLEELPRFEAEAGPALEAARRHAPALTRLGNVAAPVVADARPALRALARFASQSRPLAETLDRSIDDIFSTQHGWARAIQGQDGLGHLFRGGAGISPDLLTQLLQPPATPRQRARPDARSTSPRRREARPDGGGRPNEASPDPRDERQDAPTTAPHDQAAVLLDFLLAP